MELEPAGLNLPWHVGRSGTLTSHLSSDSLNLEKSASLFGATGRRRVWGMVLNSSQQVLRTDLFLSHAGMLSCSSWCAVMPSLMCASMLMPSLGCAE